MLELADALESKSAREFLSQQGVTTDPVEFREQLKPPQRRGLGAASGMPRSGSQPIVYSGQQLYPDYRKSVLAKIRALVGLAELGTIQPTLLWLDTDRSGSEKAITTIRWPMPDRVRSVSLAARSTRSAEIRFVSVDPEYVRQSWELLGAWLAQTVAPPHARQEAMSRHASIGLELGDAHTLAEVNHVLTSAQLDAAIGVTIPFVFASTLMTRGLITASIERVLTHIDDFVAAYNEGIEQLTAFGINAHVRPRGPDYLPLYYSCPVDNHRMRLVHVRDGMDSLAEAACSHHGRHRFHLGRGECSLAELEAAGRWSSDVTLPVYLTDLVSGVVAGRSSALYGIVLGWAQRKVLGISPHPVLVPNELRRPAADQLVDSLLFSYLTGTDA